ncbi:MAG: Fe2+-dependent dioxygenase [Porticoccaceae bacterium]
MLIYITDILPPEMLAAIAEATSDPATFVSGSGTASGKARMAKHNLQADGGNGKIRGALKTIETALLKNALFQAAARPRQLVRLMINRYDTGMSYGSHLDAPLMDGIRTDLSFTLFLSPPESYEGGHLVLEMGHGQESVKLPAGALVLYPTRYLHRVEPVTAGVRLAAVGWVRSHVRDENQRDLLFDLDTALADIRAGNGAQGLERLANLRANLLRLWVDD